MRGSPSAPLVAVRDRLNDWTPRLFPRGKSLNRKSWCCARPNTWLVEPQGLPSKVIEIQQASLGRLAMKNGLQLWNEAQKKALIFVPTLDCRSGRDGVKGQDERQSTAPLTPPRPPQEAMCVFQLTGVLAVIHGAPLVCGWTAWAENWVGHPPKKEQFTRPRFVVSHSTTMKPWLNGALSAVASIWPGHLPWAENWVGHPPIGIRALPPFARKEAKDGAPQMVWEFT